MLDELAIQAKTDRDAFEKVLKQVTPMCKTIVRRYESWVAEYDDLMNRARYDVWLAVKKFEPNKMSFLNFCRLTVLNHTKTRMRRIYGKASLPNLSAYRLDRTWETDERETESAYNMLIDPETTESILRRKFSLDRVRNILRSENLTQLEYDCLVMFWYKGYDYQTIANKLKVTSKTIDNALQRVRKKLRANESLRQEYLELTS